MEQPLQENKKIPGKNLIWFALVLAVALLAVSTILFLSNKARNTSLRTQGINALTTGAQWYVSKSGNNADGTSWATAWNELNQINWNSVQPGDTVSIDGGASQMVYTTTLTPGKSGTASSPITIALSSEAGRNGQAVIFGGRNQQLAECRTPVYVTPPPGTVRSAGIQLGGHSWVIIDGTKWRGIAIYGHNDQGIKMDSNSNNDIVKNVEIYDNGHMIFNSSANSWDPDFPGVFPAGTNNIFERDIIHDNGQDIFQTSGVLTNFTIRQSWLYNGRTHSTNQDLAYNYCRHSDGIQVYNGGVQSGVTIDSSIIGPGLMQGTILGQAPSGGNSAEVDNVTVSNTLILDTTNANLMGYPTVPSKNWTLNHITSFHVAYDPDNGQHFQVFLEGTGHQIRDSVFYGGQFYLPGGASVSGNFQFNTTGYTVGTNADPQFVNAPAYNSTPTLQGLINGDYSLQPGSPAAGKGSTITSVTQLLGSQPGTPTPTISQPPSSPTPTSVQVTLTPTTTPIPPTPTRTPTPIPPTPTRTPTPIPPTPTRTPTPIPPSPTPTPGTISFEAESCQISSPMQATQSYIFQSVQTTDPSRGGRASHVFVVPTTGNYVINTIVNAPNGGSNSFFVNIDAEPTSPLMIWDIIQTTNGFQSRTVSWRGNGNPGNNQFNPKVFYLTAGTHNLIIRGRESNTLLDRIIIQPQ